VSTGTNDPDSVVPVLGGDDGDRAYIYTPVRLVIITQSTHPRSLRSNRPGRPIVAKGGGGRGGEA